MTLFLCYFCEISICAKSTNQLFTGMEFDTVPYKIGDAHLTYYLVFHITFFYKKTDKITSILPRALCVQFICKNSLYIDFHVYPSLGILQKRPLFKILFYK